MGFNPCRRLLQLLQWHQQQPEDPKCSVPFLKWTKWVKWNLCGQILCQSHTSFAKGSDFLSLWSTLALGNVLSLACKAFVWFWIDFQTSICGLVFSAAQILQRSSDWNSEVESLKLLIRRPKTFSSQASCKRFGKMRWKSRKIAFLQEAEVERVRAACFTY